MEKGFILVLIIAIIGAIFTIANGDSVEVNFIFTKIYMSQAMVILMSTFLGAIIVFIISKIKTFKLNQEIKGLKKELEELEEENNLIKLLDQEDDVYYDNKIDEIEKNEI